MNSINNNLWQNIWPTLLRRVRTAQRRFNKYFLLIFNAVWAVPFLLTTRALRPILLIRFGSFFFERVGHFAADVGQWKAQKLVEDSGRVLDLWYLPNNHECSNEYWAQITRRWFRVYSLVRYLVFWNRIVPFGEAHSLDSSGEFGSRDVNGFLERAKLTLPSTTEEEAEARVWMTKLGWNEGDPFVCLLVRDSRYLKEYRPEYDWNYHDYRNSDVQTYIKAINFLTSKGVFVFRMGKFMEQEVNYSHSKFIDYAFRPDRTDFLDVWLFANCSFCITSGTGLDTISAVFRRPILFLNLTPLQTLWSWSNTVCCPKILTWKSSGSFLTMKEHLDNSHSYNSQYIDAGIEIVDLTEQQILDAVVEFSDYYQGQSFQAIRHQVTNKRFLEILMSHPDFDRNHGFIHPKMRIASTFIEHVGESFLG